MIQPKPLKKHNALWPFRWLIALLVGLVVIGLLFFMRTNRYIEVPGGANSLKPFVKVDGIKDDKKGTYMLTTVGIIGPASPAELLWGKFQPYSETYTQEELMGDDDSDEYNLLQEWYITSAANNAVVAAFKAAKQPVTLKLKGIYVMSIMDTSAFKDKLKLGDTITAVNGKSYTSSDAYIKAIGAHKVGDTVTLSILRNGKKLTETGKLTKLPGEKHPGIGISLTENTTVTSTPKVTIDAGDIGGPSAGLMFAVQTYTMITHQDWRNGQKIAGTGTIAAKGNVGQIGGIDKKVYICSKSGAKVFFAPDEPATKALLKLDPTYENNYDVAVKTAKQLKSKMKVVPVKTLQDALDYLKAHAK
ncbi:SepM family pheromone-processing serine protease [Lacticaseibacillus mingshuiensis]|uniref:SepM family pheromone-processing serine protease n=1 Tax=Lacticaseibacillus mingshuiensis TaxID=2799574 RepID=UPI0019512CF2|nr:SepM family pheromone-processing serine protease [Lacticaseibacillus mingshuiensis]